MQYNFEQEALNYLEEIGEDLEEIEELMANIVDVDIAQSNIAKLMRKVHSIKGSAGGFEFELISTCCHKLEDYILSHQYASNDLQEYVKSLLSFHQTMANLVLAYRFKNEKVLDAVRIQYRMEVKGLSDLPELSLINTENLNKRRILIAENSKLFQKIIFSLCLEMNYEIAIVNDGFDALSRLLKEEFDLFITSARLPTVELESLLNILNLLPNFNQDMKIIVVSSSKEIFKKIVNQQFLIIDKNQLLEKNLREKLKEVFDTSFIKEQKLLLVDDSPDIHKLVEISFKNYPHIKITHCLDPELALSIALDLRPELILLDVQMPKLSGDELFLILKSKKELSSSQIFFLTATSSEEESARLSKLTTKILKKPFFIKTFAQELLNY